MADPNPPTGSTMVKRTAEADARADGALTMRRAGALLDVIAERFECSRERARQLVRKGERRERERTKARPIQT